LCYCCRRVKPDVADWYAVKAELKAAAERLTKQLPVKKIVDSIKTIAEPNKPVSVIKREIKQKVKNMLTIKSEGKTKYEVDDSVIIGVVGQGFYNLMTNITEIILTTAPSEVEFQTLIPYIDFGIHDFDTRALKRISDIRSNPNRDLNVCGYEAYVMCTKSKISLEEFRSIVNDWNDFSMNDLIEVASSENINLLIVCEYNCSLIKMVDSDYFATILHTAKDWKTSGHFSCCTFQIIEDHGLYIKCDLSVPEYVRKCYLRELWL